MGPALIALLLLMEPAPGVAPTKLNGYPGMFVPPDIYQDMERAHVALPYETARADAAARAAAAHARAEAAAARPASTALAYADRLEKRVTEAEDVGRTAEEGRFAAEVKAGEARGTWFAIGLGAGVLLTVGAVVGAAALVAALSPDQVIVTGGGP